MKKGNRLTSGSLPSSAEKLIRIGQVAEQDANEDCGARRLLHRRRGVAPVAWQIKRARGRGSPPSSPSKVDKTKVRTTSKVKVKGGINSFVI